MKRNPLIVAAFALTLFFAAVPSWAAEMGTADEAKALLERAVAEVQADPAAAMTKFNSGEDGFKDRDLYVFCAEGESGTILAGPESVMGTDVRTLTDNTGKAFGQEMFERATEGNMVEVGYMFPRPGSTDPVPKRSFVTRIGDHICGVGTYE